MKRKNMRRDNLRANAIRAASLLFVAAIIYFFWIKVSALWPAISPMIFTPDWFYFTVGLMINTCALAAWAYVLRSILRIFHIRTSYPRVFLSFTSSIFGKYVPGKIWGMIIRMRVKPAPDISKTDVVLSSVLEGVMITASGFLVGLIAILRYFSANYVWILTCSAVAILTVIFLHPKIFYFFMNRLLSKLGKPIFPPKDRVSYAKMLALLGFSVFSWMIAGLGFFTFLHAFYPLEWTHLIDIASIAGFSFAVGNVAFFAPGGFGVREGVLLIFLSSFMPESAAVLLALMTRIQTIIGEPIALGVAYIVRSIAPRD